MIENLAERIATIVTEKINNRLDNMEKLLADKELKIEHLEQKVQKMKQLTTWNNILRDPISDFRG